MGDKERPHARMLRQRVEDSKAVREKVSIAVRESRVLGVSRSWSTEILSWCMDRIVGGVS